MRCAACVLEALEETIKEVAVERKLKPVGSSDVPKDPKAFNIQLVDYFDVVAGPATFLCFLWGMAPSTVKFDFPFR